MFPERNRQPETFAPSPPKDHRDLPSFNALLFYLAPKDFYRSAIVSSREIFCGPDCETTQDGSRILTVKTPQRKQDVATLISDLPQNQKPDLILVKVDGSGRFFPVNLKSPMDRSTSRGSRAAPCK